LVNTLELLVRGGADEDLMIFDRKCFDSKFTLPPFLQLCKKENYSHKKNIRDRWAV
jgi:hypothetical protein